MGNITIRNLDDQLKQRLRIRAAEHGHSMEEEVRIIIRDAVDAPATHRNLAASIRARIAPIGGADLTLAERESLRDPPRFG